MTDEDEIEPTGDDEPRRLRDWDPEVPEADRLDQVREVAPGERRRSVSRSIDVPEADAVEQAIEEPFDADEEAGRDEDRMRP